MQQSTKGKNFGALICSTYLMTHHNVGMYQDTGGRPENPVSGFLKPYGARCGVEKGTQMGGLLGRKGGCLFFLLVHTTSITADN
jgi:hypothetical protein